MTQNKYVEDANKIIHETFFGHGLNESLFNDFMCGKQEINYSFLTAYLSCLKNTLTDIVPKTNFEDLVTDFIPKYKDSIKYLPDTLAGCSLMTFHKIYFENFPEQQSSEHYQQIVNQLTKNDGPLCIDYKSAIAKHFPQHYKLKKANKVTI